MGVFITNVCGGREDLGGWYDSSTAALGETYGISLGFGDSPIQASSLLFERVCLGMGGTL